MLGRTGPEIYIDQPPANGSASGPMLTVKGHLSGAVPDGATVTCKLYDPSTASQPIAPSTGPTINSDNTWSCQFSGVAATPSGQQASVLASLIDQNGQDLSDYGPVLFTI
jgi:hypothetical protein